MRKFLASSLCIVLFAAFTGCVTFSEDPEKRARQIEFYKQDALENIAFISELLLTGESLEDFKLRSPKKYLAAEFAFNKTIRRLEFADEQELADFLLVAWDKLFKEET